MIGDSDTDTAERREKVSKIGSLPHPTWGPLPKVKKRENWLESQRKHREARQNAGEGAQITYM